MTAVWASHHKEGCSDGVVAPHGFDPLIGPALGMGLDRSHRGQPWTLSLRLPHMRDGLSARRMVVLSPFCRSSMGRYVHCELTRNELLDLTTVVSATACHQKNYVGTYSRSMRSAGAGVSFSQRNS